MPEITLEVLAERLENFAVSNKNSHDDIKLTMEKITDDLKEIVKDHEGRLKALEFWRVKFVAKFTAYSSIALVIGSFLGQIVTDIIKDALLK